MNHSTASPNAVPGGTLGLPLAEVPRQPPKRDFLDTVRIQQMQAEVRDSKVMIIDDEELVLRVVQRFLSSDGYSNFVTVNDSREALETLEREQPDVVLMDINMPHLSGMDLLKIRQRTNAYLHIPFIILSANSENQIKREALKLGTTDFLSKPVDPYDLVLRVQNALTVKRHFDHLTEYASELEQQVQQRIQQLDHSRKQIIRCLARAAEFRDNETGEHIIRVGKYASVIANQLGFDPQYCREIELAAQLHDVGKIGIPDAILLKPGKLTTEEFEVVKSHCLLGMKIMEPLLKSELARFRQPVDPISGKSPGFPLPMLELAVSIARSHHERWDGTGYPFQIKGENIPIEGRIVCVADVYDALCSDRPYKLEFPLEKCLEIMISERGTRFDPVVLDAFFQRIDDIESVRARYSDTKYAR